MTSTGAAPGTPTTPGAPTTLGTPPRGLVQVLVSTVAVVAVISSLGAPLVPLIAETHDVPVTTAQWALTVTFLVGAVATPVLGRLGDGPHRRAVMLGALAVVVVGSTLAALPLGFGWLLAGRALQGLGLGLAPLAMATARDALSGSRQRGAIAALSITVVAGVGLGYPVAGLVADLGGLHAAFWFGAAVAALALAAGALVLPPARSAPARAIDVPGAVLLGTALSAGLLVLSEGGAWGWTSPRVLALAAVAVLAAASWAAWALRTPTPLVDLRLARGRWAATAHLASLLVGLANYLLLSSVTVFAQTPTGSGYGFGASVVTAGLVLVPFSLASVAASRSARALSDRFGPRVAVPAGAVVLAAGLGLYALTPSSIWLLGAVMAVAGVGTGAVFALLPTLVVAAVPPGETGSAMSLNQVLRYVGFATGSAATAAVLAATTADGAAYPSAGGYSALALAGSGVAVLTALVTRLLPPRRAATVSPAG
ncbi:MFS transporter [Trujillonella endophytica]|uniref:MFS transporter n=1 Tax=Trujillonella endophytica TaxID=673521 RepID=UPI001FCCE0C9|nr:MFS transporter [Trujillella endophytica]